MYSATSYTTSRGETLEWGTLEWTFIVISFYRDGFDKTIVSLVPILSLVDTVSKGLVVCG